MYDASVKVPNGIEHGDVYQFGNFDQCIDIGTDDDAVKSKYCLADVTMDGFSIRNGAKRHFEVGYFVFIKCYIYLPIYHNVNINIDK